MDVDVGFIYTYEREFMSPLVSTLKQSASGVQMRLILVDNASTDGVAEWTAQSPGSLVVRNEQRLGYAANLNRILDVATARYVLLLNTDMYFEPSEQSVSKMVHFMDEHPDCGVSGCGLYHPDGTYGYPARRFQTLETIAARRLGLSRMLGGVVADYLHTDKPRTAVFDCDWLSGCFLMVRREAVAEIGCFDLGFRKYFEDVDFCLRMSRAGWRVMMNGQTWCYHLEQRASKNLLSQDALLHLKSYVRFLKKWGLHPEREIATAVKQKIHRRAA
ncbi:MAG: glycosyltransferase [Planctomycetes bacterium]|nr:glycosyltransferase [Planctomycetota bacterium]